MRARMTRSQLEYLGKTVLHPKRFRDGGRIRADRRRWDRWDKISVARRWTRERRDARECGWFYDRMFGGSIDRKLIE